VKGREITLGGGTIWLIGWLFTIGFANLVWWKIILGIIIWPFYLGDAVLSLVASAH
jgi:hypothetical protein